VTDYSIVANQPPFRDVVWSYLLDRNADTLETQAAQLAYLETPAGRADLQRWAHARPHVFGGDMNISSEQ
jgi:hypothetical protein